MNSTTRSLVTARRNAALALLAGCVTMAAVAHAQRALPQATEKAAREARAIVVAKVLQVDVRLEGNIYTFVRLQTLQTVKGAVPNVVTLRMLGGRIGDTELMSDPPNPAFAAGDEVVVFLGEPSREGYPSLYGDQVFQIVTLRTGLKMVARMNRDRAAPASAGVMTLADFIAALTAFARE